MNSYPRNNRQYKGFVLDETSTENRISRPLRDQWGHTTYRILREEYKEYDIATFTPYMEATDAAATIDILTCQLARKPIERNGCVSTVLIVYRYKLLFLDFVHRTTVTVNSVPVVPSDWECLCLRVQQARCILPEDGNRAGSRNITYLRTPWSRVHLEK